MRHDRDDLLLIAMLNEGRSTRRRRPAPTANDQAGAVLLMMLTLVGIFVFAAIFR
jgi:hypothetical protein